MRNKQTKIANYATALQLAEIHALYARQERMTRRYLTLYSSLFFIVSPLVACRSILSTGSRLYPSFKPLVINETALIQSTINQVIDHTRCFFDASDTFSLSFQKTYENHSVSFQLIYDLPLNEEKTSQFYYWNWWDQTGFHYQIKFDNDWSHQRFLKAKGGEVVERMIKIPSFPFIALKIPPTDCVLHAKSRVAALDYLQLMLVLRYFLILSFLHKFYISPYLIQSLFAQLTKTKISKEEGTQLIHALEKSNHALFLAAETNLKITPLFYLTVLAYVYYANSPALFSYLAYSAVVDLFTLFPPSFKKALLKKENLLKKALSEYAMIECRMSSYNALLPKSMADYFFLIESKSYRGIHWVKVCDIIKEACQRSHIEMVGQNKNLVILTGQTPFNLQQIASLHAFIEKQCQRIKAIKHLNEQFVGLDKAINQDNQLISMAVNQVMGEEESQLIWLVPEYFKSLFTLHKLNSLFKPSHLELHCIEGDEEVDPGHYLRIMMRAHQPGDEDLIKALHQDIKQLKSQENKNNQNTVFMTEKKERRGSTGSRRGSMSEDQTPHKPLIPQSLNPLIQWESAASDNPEVTPIVSKYLPSRKFFTFFALKKEEFKGDDKTYDKLKEKTSRAKIALKKGAEGIKFIGHEEGLQLQETLFHDSSFFPTFKIKVLGIRGYERAYGEQEQSSSGEVLLVVKEIRRSH